MSQDNNPDQVISIISNTDNVEGTYIDVISIVTNLILICNDLL